MGQPQGTDARRRSIVGHLAALALVAAVITWNPQAGPDDAQQEALGFLLPPASLRGSLPHGNTRFVRSGEAQGVAPTVSVLAASVALAMALGMRGATRCQASKDGKKLEEWKMGDSATGTVVRSGPIGIYFDIGADKDALMPKAEVPPGVDWKAGETVENLVVSQVLTGEKPADRKIRVALSSSAASMPVSPKPKAGAIVEGTVFKSNAIGVFVNWDGNSGLIPKSTLKDGQSFKDGDLVKARIEKIDSGSKIMLSLDLQPSVSTGGSSSSGAGQGKVPTKGLKEGQTVTGTLANMTGDSWFFDIGTERPALCRKSQIISPDDFSIGRKVDLKVLKLMADDKVELTMKPFPNDCKVGDKMEGTVKTITDACIFFDAGYCTDVMAPRSLLKKEMSQYSVGEVSDLIVVQVTQNRVTVSTKAVNELGKPISTLFSGQKVSGKVLRVNDPGLFVDIGTNVDALFRAETLPKSPEEYQVGDVLDLIVIKVDNVRQRVEVTSIDSKVQDGPARTKLEDITVGSVVSGKVKRAAEFGIFVDIGAERDALYDKGQLDMPLSDYKVGDVIEGLKVVQCDPIKRRLSVSKKTAAADWASRKGEVVRGTVLKVAEFGIFIDIGASCDALMFKDNCAKAMEEYKPGDVLDDLKVSNVNPEANKITVYQMEAGAASATVKAEDLEVGQKLQGAVKLVKDYGVFVGIGTARDALLPRNLLPRGKTTDNYKVGELLDVYVLTVDAAKNQITLSAEVLAADDPRRRAPSKAGGRGGAGVQRVAAEPGVELYHHHMQGTSDAMYKENGWERLRTNMDQPVPWELWAKKYPEFVKFPDPNKNTEDHHEFFTHARDHDALLNIMQANSGFIPVPFHLRRPDAGPATVENMAAIRKAETVPTWDSGIKPEIHVKYRQPPHNFPNWTRECPEQEDQVKWTEKLNEVVQEKMDAGWAPKADDMRKYGKYWKTPDATRTPHGL